MSDACDTSLSFQGATGSLLKQKVWAKQCTLKGLLPVIKSDSKPARPRDEGVEFRRGLYHSAQQLEFIGVGQLELNYATLYYTALIRG